MFQKFSGSIFPFNIIETKKHWLFVTHGGTFVFLRILKVLSTKESAVLAAQFFFENHKSAICNLALLPCETGVSLDESISE